MHRGMAGRLVKKAKMHPVRGCEGASIGDGQTSQGAHHQKAWETRSGWKPSVKASRNGDCCLPTVNALCAPSQSGRESLCGRSCPPPATSSNSQTRDIPTTDCAGQHLGPDTTINPCLGRIIDKIQHRTALTDPALDLTKIPDHLASLRHHGCRRPRPPCPTAHRALLPGSRRP